MPDRILDISTNSGRLRLRLDQLVFERDGGLQTVSVPLEDLAALVVSNPRVTYTHALLSALAEKGCVLVVCDGSFTPSAILTPLVGHTTQTERLASQVNASLPTRKRLWRSIVQAKVKAQAGLLRETRGDDAGIAAMAARVGSGDPTNVEAQAARRYWSLLFDDPDFRRGGPGGPNPLLNYGYGVLRGITARAIVGSGLHPSLGLHHRNRYNAFCLADDLMEPFRPIVDRGVLRVLGEFGRDVELSPAVKARLLEGLTDEVDLDGESRTLFDCLARLAASLAGVFAGKRKGLALPKFE